MYIKSLFLLAFVATVAFVNVWQYFEFDQKFCTSKFEKTIDIVCNTFFISSFGFFSPHIPDGYELIVIEINPDGKTMKTPFVFSQDEMNNKLLSITHKFYEQEELRDIYAYSMASYYLNQHPETSTIIFCLYQYHLPKIQEFSKGSQPSTTLVYAREFKKIN